MFRSTYTAYLVTFPEAVKTGPSGTSDLDSVACWFHSRVQQLSCDFYQFLQANARIVTQIRLNISVVKPTRCKFFEFIEYKSTWFGGSFRPSSGVQDCTHSIKYVIQVSWLLASKQSTNVYDIYLMLCVQSWTPDDGRKDRPKHVEWYLINSKIYI